MKTFKISCAVCEKESIGINTQFGTQEVFESSCSHLNVNDTISEMPDNTSRQEDGYSQ
jgi:hypothetical protein